jgi:hypothetical protein
MTINYPDSLDALSNPSGTDSLSNPSHSQQHSNANDAIEALQVKVGIDNSSDINSLDYKVSTLEGQVSNIGDLTTATETLFGLEGNNNLVISGIENKTTVDSFDSTVYRTVKYVLQISRGSSYYSSDISVLQEGSDINVSESNIISNTNVSLATVTFEKNSGIIDLCVTPASTAVTARYYRTALKI